MLLVEARNQLLKKQNLIDAEHKLISDFINFNLTEDDINRAVRDAEEHASEDKKRKEEALRKLDRTHNNVDRVNDIISELELQVGPLKEQSEKAEEYLENKGIKASRESSMYVGSVPFI